MGPCAEIICVGDELLTGDTIDTNSAEIGRFLRLRGIAARRAVSVADATAAIAGALAQAVEADLCVVTGGLGPTRDDLTAAALAEVAGVECVLSPVAVAAVEAALASRGRGVDPIQLRQAEIPAGAEVIANPGGIAPGFAVEIAGRLVIALPGVPEEVRAMLADGVSTLLERRFAARPRVRRVLRCFGLREAEVAAHVEPAVDALRGEDPRLDPLVIHYRARGPEVDVTLDVDAIAEAAVERLERRLRDALGDACYAVGEVELSARIAAILIARGLTLGTAESCTGGRVAAAMTANAGVSACFHGAVVAYDNAIKAAVLGIPMEVIEAHGAVSEPVARGMAAGVRAALAGHADIGVGITGIAGPGGGSDAKPVGTVDIAVDDGEASRYRRFHFRGDRPTIQRRATQWALWMVFHRLRERGLSEVSVVD
ncbi:MAG: CinA family nicotinamide mononucleotide deamidase-related protein [Nannocystaceae bacterium]